MKKCKWIILLMYMYIGLTTSYSDWYIANLAIFGDVYEGEIPSDIRVIDFSDNLSDDVRDWRNGGYATPIKYPALVNIRYNVFQALSSEDSIESAKSNLWITIARQAEVTPRQFRLALLDIDVTPSDVEAALNTIEDEKLKNEALIEWEYAQTIRRDHPLISQIAPLLGGTDEILDQIFLNALEK